MGFKAATLELMTPNRFARFIRNVVPLFSLLLCCRTPATREQQTVPYPFIRYPLEKVRPLQQPHASSRARLYLAGNEYETVMVGIYNPTSTPLAVREIKITSPLNNQLTVQPFLIWYYRVKEPTRWYKKQGIKGLWPDPLLPLTATPDKDTLRYPLEPPLLIPPSQNRLFLIEFYLPAAASRPPPQSYRIDLFTSLSSPLSVHLEVNTYAFDLPWQTSHRTAFGFSRKAVTEQHKKQPTQEFNQEQLLLDYLELLAKHRIAVYYPFPSKIPYSRNQEGTLHFQWQDFDESYGALLDGRLFPNAPPASSFRMVEPEDGLSASEQKIFYRRLVGHLKERGWLNRMFYYVFDEPLLQEYKIIKERAGWFKAVAPEIPILLTEPYTSDLEGLIDIWCPDLPMIGDSIPFLPLFMRGRDMRLYPEWQINLHPFIYEKRRNQGEETWFYTCTSAQVAEYPDLFIDSPANAHRIIPWLMYKYGFTGYLSWDTTNSYSGDPWEEQYDFQANGDGTLLYPGYPELPYVRDHTPLPSLRLKILREGFEDYEYLKYYERLAGINAARFFSHKLVTSSLIWTHDPEALLVQKRTLAARIEEQLKR